VAEFEVRFLMVAVLDVGSSLGCRERGTVEPSKAACRVADLREKPSLVLKGGKVVKVPERLEYGGYASLGKAKREG